MDGVNPVKLQFNVETGDYIKFVKRLSKTLADHTDSYPDKEKHGDHPLLPKQAAGKPKRWMCIKLLAKNKNSEERNTTLAVRDDNVYLCGFKNQSDKNQSGNWYEFGEAPTRFKKSSTKSKKSPPMTKEEQSKLTRLIPGSTNLGFPGRHEELLSPSLWTCNKKAELGMFSARDAVVELSNYTEEGKQKDGKKKDSIKPHLFKLIVMICESARMFPYRDKVKKGWGPHAGVTLEDVNNNLTEYLHNWKHMSQAMMGWAHYNILKLQKLGIIGHKEACKVVHLILNSPNTPPGGKLLPFYESAGGDGPGKENPGDRNNNPSQHGDEDGNGQSSMQGGSDDQSWRKGEGNGQWSRQGEGDGQWSHREHGNGHPPQPTDGTEYVHHGQRLVEVFTLGPASSADKLCSSITVFDGRLGQIIFSNEGCDDKEGNIILDGPYRGISADGRVALKIVPYTEEDGDGQEVLIWDPYTNDEHQYDQILALKIVPYTGEDGDGQEVLIWKPYTNDEHQYDQIPTKDIAGGLTLLSKDIAGCLTLTYAVLKSAVETSVQVDVFLFENIAMHGDIIVKSKLARGEEATVVLVRYEVDDQVELVASSAGSRIPLTRSVVAWPVDSRIDITVDCCFQHVTTPTDEGTSSIASATTPLGFTFHHRTEKVCFHTLEGIGYVRVCVDDTREYRVYSPSNALPRSLMNDINKNNTDISVMNGLLVVHPGQVTYTFQPNKIMSCLLHLTNKSYHSKIAFRRRLGPGILKLSGILPPDSTSTFLVRLESLLQPDMKAFTFILDSCVVPEEVDEDEDVDNIFDMHTNDGIVEKVTIPVTVCCPGDETTTTSEPIQPGIEIIPSAGQGSNHSTDVPQEEPLMAKDFTYPVVRSAVEATVQVDLFLSEKTDFYGKITAHSQAESTEEISVLFNCEIKDRLVAGPSPTGWTVPLAQSDVTWPVGSPLLIKVACFHSVTLYHEGLDLRTKGGHLYCSTTNTSTIHDPLKKKQKTSTIHEDISASTTTTPIFEGLDISFYYNNNTDKVRFATLEGFGYIRVSVDDTGKKLDNSLPRSLMHQIETDICKETKLLVIQPSHLMPGLLHLTNKSEDQPVAFQCGELAHWFPKEESGTIRWQFSGILSPDSTSTYMVLGLKTSWHQNALSLVLQSYAVSWEEKESWEEKRLDKILFNAAENDIDEVTISCPPWKSEKIVNFFVGGDITPQWIDPWVAFFRRPDKGIKEVTIKATISDPTDVTMISEMQIKAPTAESSIDQSDLLDVYPLQLCFFPFKLNKVMCCPVRLTNKTDDYVIFRFTPFTTHSNLVQLYKGSLPPRSTCTYVLATQKLNCVPHTMDELSVILQSCAAENIIHADEYISSQDPMHGVIPQVICERQPIPPKIEILTMQEYPSTILSMDVHPTKPWILFGDTGGNVSIWNYKSQEKVKEFRGVRPISTWPTDLEVTSVKFIAHGEWFVAGHSDGHIYVFSCITMRAVKRFQAHTEVVTSLAVHPNQRFLLSGSVKSIYDPVKLWKWDVNPDAEWECVQRYGNTGLLRHVVFNPYDNGDTFATASEDCKVQIWSTNDQDSSPKPIAILNCYGQQSLAYFSLSGQQYIITGSSRGIARIWDLRTNICIKELGGPQSSEVGSIRMVGVIDCAQDNINPVLITASTDHDISFLDPVTYKSRYGKIKFGLGEARDFTYVEVDGKRSIVIAFNKEIAIMEMNEDRVSSPATMEQGQSGAYSA